MRGWAVWSEGKYWLSAPAAGAPHMHERVFVAESTSVCLRYLTDDPRLHTHTCRTLPGLQLAKLLHFQAASIILRLSDKRHLLTSVLPDLLQTLSFRPGFLPERRLKRQRDQSAGGGSVMGGLVCCRCARAETSRQGRAAGKAAAADPISSLAAAP